MSPGVKTSACAVTANTLVPRPEGWNGRRGGWNVVGEIAGTRENRQCCPQIWVKLRSSLPVSNRMSWPYKTCYLFDFIYICINLVLLNNKLLLNFYIKPVTIYCCSRAYGSARSADLSQIQLIPAELSQKSAVSWLVGWGQASSLASCTCVVADRLFAMVTGSMGHMSLVI